MVYSITVDKKKNLLIIVREQSYLKLQWKRCVLLVSCGSRISKLHIGHTRTEHLDSHNHFNITHVHSCRFCQFYQVQVSYTQKERRKLNRTIILQDILKVLRRGSGESLVVDLHKRRMPRLTPR